MRVTLPLPALWEQMSLSGFRKYSNLSWNLLALCGNPSSEQYNFALGYAKISTTCARQPGVDWLQST